MEKHVATILVSMIAIGMAGIFYRADKNSPTTRASSLFLALVGLAALWTVAAQTHPFVQWGTFSNIVGRSYEAFATIAGIEWVRRVGKMLAQEDGRRWFGGIMERFAQILMVAYWILVLIFPNLRPIQFPVLFSNPGEVFHLAFWIHFLPQQIALWLTGLSVLITYLRPIDQAEKDRLVYLVISVPFFMAATWWSRAETAHLIPLVLGVGLLIYFAGTIRYLIVQGQRATFMRRFMPKEVAHMVRQKGLKSAIQPDELDISVVACDLRGFTKYAAENDSKLVLTLLHDYYAVVHEAAQEFGGTVKDHAGDGVLTLVGAPVVMDDHRQRAEDMARVIRDKGCALIEQRTEGQVGLGVGLASGTVTTGAVGGSRRLEYVAVGSAVNMAARLCDKAANGDILTDVVEGQSGDLVLDLKGYTGEITASRLA
ncbi:MAG: adenylate/guanylate cyclase domain-containing protein [Gammaproteobacteria bacterium]|nr:adenylate/guanylate cyclase domain-containing protein [Gammaproteobacteria bacterium]